MHTKRSVVSTKNKQPVVTRRNGRMKNSSVTNSQSSSVKSPVSSPRKSRTGSRFVQASRILDDVPNAMGDHEPDLGKTEPESTVSVLACPMETKDDREGLDSISEASSVVRPVHTTRSKSTEKNSATGTRSTTRGTCNNVMSSPTGGSTVSSGSTTTANSSNLTPASRLRLTFADGPSIPDTAEQGSSDNGRAFRGHELHVYLMNEPDDQTCVLFRMVPTVGERARCYPAFRLSKMRDTFPEFCAEYRLFRENTRYLTDGDGNRITNVTGGWIPLLPVRVKRDGASEPDVGSIRELAEQIIIQLAQDPAFNFKPPMRVAPLDRFVLSDTRKWVELIGLVDTKRYLIDRCGNPVLTQEREFYEAHREMIWACFRRGRVDPETKRQFGIPDDEEEEEENGVDNDENAVPNEDDSDDGELVMAD